MRRLAFLVAVGLTALPSAAAAQPLSDAGIKTTFSAAVTTFNGWWYGDHSERASITTASILTRERTALVRASPGSASGRAGRATAVRALDHLIEACQAWARYRHDVADGMDMLDPLPAGESMTEAKEAERARPLLETAALTLNVRIKLFAFKHVTL